ncbi:hypothetical protein VCR12J2_50004 [Vibrio coralliirubri]|nr:hypothetical protein VCR12J2_50004 [Vibrio coralliirubri]
MAKYMAAFTASDVVTCIFNGRESMNVKKQINEDFIEKQGETSHSGNVQNRYRE